MSQLRRSRAGRPRGERGDTPLPHGLLHPCLTPLPQPLPLRRFQRALVSARCDFFTILGHFEATTAPRVGNRICTCQLKTVHFNQLCDGSQSSSNYARKSIENRPKNKQSRPKISAQSVQNKYILRASGPHSGPISGSLWQSASPSLPWKAQGLATLGGILAYEDPALPDGILNPRR